MTSWVIEISPGVWLAPWLGDPGRTTVKNSARKFKTLHGARVALGVAKRKYPDRFVVSDKIEAYAIKAVASTVELRV